MTYKIIADMIHVFVEHAIKNLTDDIHNRVILFSRSYGILSSPISLMSGYTKNNTHETIRNENLIKLNNHD